MIGWAIFGIVFAARLNAADFSDTSARIIRQHFWLDCDYRQEMLRNQGENRGIHDNHRCFALSILAVALLSLTAKAQHYRRRRRPVRGQPWRPYRDGLRPGRPSFRLPQNGHLRVIKNGTLRDFVCVTVGQLLRARSPWRGFDPNFSSNQFVYLYYTTDTYADTIESAGSPRTVMWPRPEARLSSSTSIISAVPRTITAAPFISVRMESSMPASVKTPTPRMRKP